MKSAFVIALLIAVLCLVEISAQNFCSTDLCVAPERCCNTTQGSTSTPVCFSEDAYDCVVSEGSGDTVLCPNGDLACSGASTGGFSACYSPSLYACLRGTDGTVTELCPVNNGLCSNRCFARRTHRCINSAVLCGVNDELCGSTCFSPLTHTCDNGRLRALTPQEQQNKICGSTTCGASEQCCGGTQCFDPATQVCQFAEPNLFGPVVCPRGNVACQLRNQPSATCIDASREFCLSQAPGNLICPIGGPLSACRSTP